MIKKHGTTDVSVYFILVDSDGNEATGLTIADLTASYVRTRAERTGSALTALTATDAAHEDYKAIEIDSVNCPGLYRVDFPDAAFAAGADAVQLSVTGDAIKPAYIEVELTPKVIDDLNDFDPTVDKVEIVGTKNRLDDLNDIDGNSVKVATNNDKTGYSLTSDERSSIAAAVWSATTRTLSSFGSLVSDTASAVWGAVTRTLTAGTRDDEIDAIAAKLPTGDIADQTAVLAIKAKTDNLDYSGNGGMLKSESTNMRGTDGAYTGTPPTVNDIVAGIEDEQGKLHETLSRAENADELLRAMTENDGQDNTRYTAKALEQAPTGDSVWTTEQRDAVLTLAETTLITQTRINTATTPWRLELLAGETVVKAYACYDIDGNPITDTATIIARYSEVSV